MKNLFKALGFTIGALAFVIGVNSIIEFTLNKIQELGDFTNTQMVYGFATFVLVFIFTVIYSVISKKK